MNTCLDGQLFSRTCYIAVPMGNTAACAWILVFALLSCGSVRAEFLDADIPRNITSDGSGGRRMIVEPGDSAGFRFFPAQINQRIDEPSTTPPSPAQSDLLLIEGQPLRAVIPQLAHRPMLARVDVDYTIDGHDIIVDATLALSDVVTATIYGPHEYLLPIGTLEAGAYRLQLNLIQGFDVGNGIQNFNEYRSYIEFSVFVPEPSSLAVLSCAWLLVRRKNSQNPRKTTP